jgi:hypothetical protein
VTARLHTRKSGVERLAAWFTDHLEVVLWMAIDAPLPLQGRSYWRMNYSLLQSEAFEKEIDDQWRTWQQHKLHYNNYVTWWGTYVKKKLRMLSIKEGTNRRRDIRQMEVFTITPYTTR